MKEKFKPIFHLLMNLSNEELEEFMKEYRNIFCIYCGRTHKNERHCRCQDDE